MSKKIKILIIALTAIIICLVATIVFRPTGVKSNVKDIHKDIAADQKSIDSISRLIQIDSKKLSILNDQYDSLLNEKNALLVELTKIPKKYETVRNNIIRNDTSTTIFVLSNY